MELKRLTLYIFDLKITVKSCSTLGEHQILKWIAVHTCIYTNKNSALFEFGTFGSVYGAISNALQSWKPNCSYQTQVSQSVEIDMTWHTVINRPLDVKEPWTYFLECILFWFTNLNLTHIVNKIFTFQHLI